MFVLAHHDRVTLFLRHGHRHDLAVEEARLLRSNRALLRCECHAVLCFALDLVFSRDVLGGLGHRVHAIKLFHLFVDEAPADGRVVHRVGATEGGLGLGHHERCAAHALHTTGDHQARLASPDGARCRAHCIESRSAQPIDGGAAQFERQAGQQRRHTRHVSVVFTGLVGAAVQHIADGLPVDFLVAFHEGTQRDGAEVIGPHAAEGTAVATERRADGVADEGFNVAHDLVSFNGLSGGDRKADQLL